MGKIHTWNQIKHGLGLIELNGDRNRKHQIWAQEGGKHKSALIQLTGNHRGTSEVHYSTSAAHVEGYMLEALLDLTSHNYVFTSDEREKKL